MAVRYQGSAVIEVRDGTRIDQIRHALSRLASYNLDVSPGEADDLIEFCFEGFMTWKSLEEVDIAIATMATRYSTRGFCLFSNIGDEDAMKFFGSSRKAQLQAEYDLNEAQISEIEERNRELLDLMKAEAEPIDGDGDEEEEADG